MTPEDIIRMAREADINAESDTLCRFGGWVEPLERFAALVAAAEREECAKACEGMEAAAWDLHDKGEDFDAAGKAIGAIACAAAIRARGKSHD